VRFSADKFGMFRARATTLIGLVISASFGAAGVCAQSAQSEPALWRFVMPNASAVAGLNWARIRDSPAGAMLRDKVLAERWTSHHALAAFPGLDLLDSVDRILISSSGAIAPESPSDSGDARGENGDSPTSSSPILVAAQGRFDPVRVRELFARSGTRQSYNAFQVYRPKSKQNRNMAYVLFDPQTILFGDAPSVFAALDRNQFADAPRPAPAGPATMAARAGQLEGRYELWAILDVEELLASDTVAAFLQDKEWTSVAQGMEIGLSLRAGLDADFILRFSSDDMAKRVTAQLTHAVNAAAKDRGLDARARDMARKLRFNVDGSAAKISLQLSEQELEQVAQAFMEGEKAASAKAASAKAETAPVPAAAAPSPPGVIRIEGLDDGPREIPVGGPDR
jgi:hypothetical protein